MSLHVHLLAVNHDIKKMIPRNSKRLHDIPRLGVFFAYFHCLRMTSAVLPTPQSITEGQKGPLHQRAEEIAQMLGDNKQWHSHGRRLVLGQQVLEILQHQEQVIRIGRAGLNFPRLVPPLRRIVLGVDQQAANASDVGGLSRAQQRILQ